MQIDPKAIKNILAVRNDRFGEFLLNIPALRALKETFTEAKLTLVVDPYVQELAQDISFVDEVITWRQDRRSLLEKIGLLRLIASKKIDLAVILNPSREFNIFTWLAGIPLRLGYDRKWGFLLTHKLADRKHLAEKHEVEYNLELVGLIASQTQDKGLYLRTNDNTLKELFFSSGLSELGRIIAIHPWTSDSFKQWPLENFSILAKRLLAYPDLKIAVIGTKEDLEKSRNTFIGIDDNLINLTGKTTLRQLAAFLKRCRLLISGDSGPVHLACAVGTPVVAIFRNDLPGKSPNRWGPWGEGHVVIEKDKLYKITVDEVFNQVKEILER